MKSETTMENMLNFEHAWRRRDDEDRPGDLLPQMLLSALVMPTAIRAMDDSELQVLLLALLREWRRRVQVAQPSPGRDHRSGTADIDQGVNP